MFDEKYLIPRNKLMHPAWVLYKDEADAIGKTGVGQTKDKTKPYKPWSDPTHVHSSMYGIFTGDYSSEGYVTYWVLSGELASIDDERVKRFYRENAAWRAYQTMIENRYVFTKGVPYCYEIFVPKKDALEANFENKGDLEYGYPLQLNVANEAVILLPPYLTGKTEVVGIPYQKFIQGLPKVVKEDKIKVIVGICNNAAFAYEDKIAAIIKVVTSPDTIPDPSLTGEGSKKEVLSKSSLTPKGLAAAKEDRENAAIGAVGGSFSDEVAKKYAMSLKNLPELDKKYNEMLFGEVPPPKENVFVGGFLNEVE